ncbi:MAG: MerR family transcriptional regulator [Treponema sp.]|jgi:DNA-binding transcriptional MerR regulator|nr:MerR family transcriptional regulator [Treponema sp.]
MTIGEVGEKYGLTIDTLRYYERIGLIPPVTRSRGGIRNYGETDCRWVEFIKCMRSAGIPVEVLIEYVSLFEHGETTQETRKRILREQRELLAARIAELQKTAELLDYKIANYDTILVEYEKKLQ